MYMGDKPASLNIFFSGFEKYSGCSPMERIRFQGFGKNRTGVIGGVWVGVKFVLIGQHRLDL